MSYLLHIWPDAPQGRDRVTFEFDDFDSAELATADKIPAVSAFNLVRKTVLGGPMGGPSLWHGSRGRAHDNSRFGEIWWQSFKMLTGFPNSNRTAGE